MRYFEARYRASTQEEIYRAYMAKGIKALAGMNVEYSDLSKPQKVETRTGDEIIAHIKDGIGALRHESDGVSGETNA